MKKIKIIAGIIAFIAAAIYIFGEWNIRDNYNKNCSKNTINLVDAIHVGMNAADVINIFQENGISYSIWKDEVEVEMEPTKPLPFPLEIVGVVKKKWTLLIGRKELIIVNFSEGGNVTDHSCKVVLTGP